MNKDFLNVLVIFVHSWAMNETPPSEMHYFTWNILNEYQLWGLMLLKIQYLVLHNICHIVNTCLFSEKLYCSLLIESQNKVDKEKAAFGFLRYYS